MKIITTFTLMIILSISFSNAQEFEVDGDLKVTGTVESATIDSLQQVIANMQAQIDAMHADNQLETRVFELPRIDFQSYEFFYDIDINEITGEELNLAMIKIIRVNDWYIDNNYCTINLETSFTHYNESVTWMATSVQIENGGTIDYTAGGRDYTVYDGRNDIRLDFQVSNGWVDLVLAITAKFPD